MEYKRLTTKDEEGNWQVWEDDYSHPFEALQVAIDRLAELEDKIEQGKMIELPCKVGDTVYDVSSRELLDCFVEKIEIGLTERKNVYITISINYKTYTAHEVIELFDIGKTVFLTREEAEKRLKELQDE